MRKKFLMMGIIFFVISFINVNGVKAVLETDIITEKEENGGVMCPYTFPKNEKYGLEVKMVRCYFWKSNKNKKQFDMNHCLFIGKDGTAEGEEPVRNYLGNDGMGFGKLSNNYGIKDFIYFDGEGRCPEYAVGGYPPKNGKRYDIILLPSKKSFEDFVKETKITSKRYNFICPGGCYIDVESPDGNVESEGGYSSGGSHIEVVEPEYSKGCAIFGEKTLKRLKWVYSLLRIAAPLLVIVLSIASFLGAVFSGEEKSLEEAKRKFINRLVAAIILVLFPFLLEFLVDLLSLAGVDADNIFCGIIN